VLDLAILLVLGAEAGNRNVADVVQKDDSAADPNTRRLNRRYFRDLSSGQDYTAWAEITSLQSVKLGTG
jgi:hypothetical protein